MTLQRLPAYPPLSERDTEVIRHVVVGMTNKEVASAMLIGEQNVKNRLVRIYRKLGTRDRAALLLWAQRHGLREEEQWPLRDAHAIESPSGAAGSESSGPS